MHVRPSSNDDICQSATGSHQVSKAKKSSSFGSMIMLQSRSVAPATSLLLQACAEGLKHIESMLLCRPLRDWCPDPTLMCLCN